MKGAKKIPRGGHKHGTLGPFVFKENVIVPKYNDEPGDQFSPSPLIVRYILGFIMPVAGGRLPVAGGRRPACRDVDYPDFGEWLHFWLPTSGDNPGGCNCASDFSLRLPI